MCFNAANDIKLVPTERETTEKQPPWKKADPVPKATNTSCRLVAERVQWNGVLFVLCFVLEKGKIKASVLQLL